MRLPMHIHMVGVGGIGMSALAQLLAREGRRITGTDREKSPTIELLRAKGIPVYIDDKGVHMPQETELLIYSDAVWADNAERVRAKERGIPELSYFEALGIVSEGKRTFAVTGTHGKTTTTGMLAAILAHAGKEPTAIIGSIVADFGSNFLPGRDDLLVVEACEYKDHMLKLSPEVLVITNAEWDHTDYFPTLEAMLASFNKAARAVPRTGVVVAEARGANMERVLQGVSARIVEYSNIAVPDLALPGEFNRMNARAAKAAARAGFPDIPESVADTALASFKGSWRRFEYKGKTPRGALVYDDYAHHPTAIRKTLEAARHKFPGRSIVLAFHPHLYSRTRDLLDDFARALAGSDLALIAPIYAAREKDDGRTSNALLADAVNRAGGKAEALDFDAIGERLLAEPAGTVIFTMGAGDIYKVAERITKV